MASGTRLGDIIGIREELIKRACSCAMKAHKSPEKPFILEKTRGSSDTLLFSFPGSWFVTDWCVSDSFNQKPFGETEINRSHPPNFPSLRSIGNDKVATVNQAFLQRFEDKILGSPDFKDKIQKAMTGKKQIVFTGHSMGGSMAILATLWFLESYVKPENRVPPFCVTFGCSLTGDHIFSHALRREKWASYFRHFVMRYDIVPRALLAPIPSVQEEFESVLKFFNTKSTSRVRESTSIPKEASDFYEMVMNDALSVASHVACSLMGNKNLLLETVSSFVAVSPYKPFGTYIFCTGNGKLVVLRNPDAVLQLFFYSAQLSNETELEEIASKSLYQHFGYENELQESLEMQDVVELNQLETLPYSAEVSSGDSATINSALDDLGLTKFKSMRARLCLRAAGEFERGKQKNKDEIDAKKTVIDVAINKLESYRKNCQLHGVGYYDAFKLHKNYSDFVINVEGIKLGGEWTKIIQMVREYQLPDDFEVQEDWIELGRRTLRIVEPIGIANYYRHSKNEDAGPYMGKGRSTAFKCKQRWLEHARRMPAGSCGESHFWAEVEELRTKTSSIKEFEDVKERVLQLEKIALKWIEGGELDEEVLWEGSTFVKWWKTLPDQHKEGSCLRTKMIR